MTFRSIPLPTDPAYTFNAVDDGTLWVRIAYSDRRDVEVTLIDFGLTDSKNRSIGARLSTFRIDRTPHAGYHTICRPDDLGIGWYCLTVHATRNNKVFGSSNAVQYFRTSVERDAAAAKYLAAAKKRAAKKCA